jgi:uncharacterized protein
MNVIVESDVYMTTRDGVRLACDVYRPATGAHPVLLHRIPYNKKDAIITAPIADPVRLAQYGYAVVLQDVRGAHASEGILDFIYQERDDGYDAVEWAAAQPWSTGDVGVWGASFMGATTYQCVAARPPHLKAAMAFVACPGVKSQLIQGGAFSAMGSWAVTALGLARQNIARLDLPEAERARLLQHLAAAVADIPGMLSQLPVVSNPLLADARLTGAIARAVQESRTSAAWLADEETLATHPEWAEVPLAIVEGAYDTFTDGTLKLFKAIQHRGPHEFVFGPWSHTGIYDAYAGGGAGERLFANAPGGPPAWEPYMMAWFNKWLKGDDSAKRHKVLVYMIGENRWTSADAWPEPTAELEYKLQSAGHANTAQGDGDLVVGEVSGSAHDSYRYDPMNPAPTMGGYLTRNPMGTPGRHGTGIVDQRPLEQRHDVLVYTSQRVAKALRVLGNPKVVLWVSSSAVDTDFIVRLVDYEPDGYSANVSEGNIRMRYRAGGEETWLSPDEIVELTIALRPTAYTFQPGHRIRLHVTSSSFPQYTRNLNSRIRPEMASASDSIVAEQTIHHDSSHQSRLLLPIIDNLNFIASFPRGPTLT